LGQELRLPATTGLMTVDEFRQLPETGPFYYELHHGELVKVTRPRLKHILIQKRLLSLFEPLIGAGYWCSLEVPFRALPEYELRTADFAVVGMARLQQADPEDDLRGAPDLVLEVLSPSNTMIEILEKERLCLENGCAEFWVVDPKLRQVKVSKPDGLTRTYLLGRDIPLDLFGGVTLPVSAIFE
jgi:Uma2 family endonuclease